MASAGPNDCRRSLPSVCYSDIKYATLVDALFVVVVGGVRRSCPFCKNKLRLRDESYTPYPLFLAGVVAEKLYHDWAL